MGAILGKKIGMTRLFNENREAVPCTIIQAGPCFVTQVKNVGTDGYDAYQVGIGERKEAKVNKPMLGHYKKAGVAPGYMTAEFDTSMFEGELTAGSPVLVESFIEGEIVDVQGVSKGKDLPVLSSATISVVASGHTVSPTGFGHRVRLAELQIHRAHSRVLGWVAAWELTQ